MTTHATRMAFAFSFSVAAHLGGLGVWNVVFSGLISPPRLFACSPRLSARSNEPARLVFVQSEGLPQLIPLPSPVATKPTPPTVQITASHPSHKLPPIKPETKATPTQNVGVALVANVAPAQIFGSHPNENVRDSESKILVGAPTSPTATDSVANPSKVLMLTRPEYLQKPSPRYPRQARQRGEQGAVLLRFEVSKEGTPNHVEVARSSGSQTLDEAALEGVRPAKLLPPRPGDKPVVEQLITFKLTSDGREF